jgi:hypothetical protein
MPELTSMTLFWWLRAHSSVTVERAEVIYEKRHNRLIDLAAPFDSTVPRHSQ